MKKLFLIICLLPSLLNGASADSFNATQEDTVPAFFDVQNIPQISELTSIETMLQEIREFITSNNLEAENHKEKFTANLNFEHLKSKTLEIPFIQALQEKADTAAALLAFITKEFVEHKHQNALNMSLFENKPFFLQFCELHGAEAYKNVTLKACYCTKHYIRIFDIFLTTLAILELYQTQQLDILIYSSLASGELLHDYVILATLIKCGLALQVNIIDILYKEDFSEKELQDMQALTTKEKTTITAQERKTLTNMRHLEATHLQIADFTFKLRNILESYSTATEKEYNMSRLIVAPWENTDQYLHFLKENNLENFKPHVLTLVDPEPKYAGVIAQDATKIKAHFNKRENLYHKLEVCKNVGSKTTPLEFIIYSNNHQIHEKIPLKNY